LVTGADGFIGRALVRRLLDGAGTAAPLNIERLILVDEHFERAATDPRVRQVIGSIVDKKCLSAFIDERIDWVFHLASVPGGRAEADFALGLQVNLSATIDLLEALRKQAQPPRFVFASSIGVYGVPLPALIDETTPAIPSLSYGAHKLIGEILVADYSRRGFIDGRSLRLPGIVARPPQASGLLSAFMSDLIRRLSAKEQFICPVSAQGMAWWMSRAQVVENLLHAAQMTVTTDSHTKVWLLPVLHASLGEIVAAIATVHGSEVLQKVTYEPNAKLQAQFANYPPLECPKAVKAGFRHDGSLEALVQRALE
jgi:nucleoside-diphosphate-sugar epimerase